MRNLIYAINVTIDGCCDHTKTVADEELLAYYTPLVRDADLSQLIELGLVDEYRFVLCQSLLEKADD